MTFRANDTWGTIITTPPVYYTTTDASALSVSLTKEAIDLAIGAWGNYGPVEVNIIGNSVNAALQLEAEYSARHEALDPLWNKKWDSPSTDPSSGYHTFLGYAGSTDASVGDYRRDYLSHDFFMLTMGTNHFEMGEEYQRIVMHEYWHVYQNAHVMDLSNNDSRFVNPRDEKIKIGYMTEGGANYMALKLYNSTHDMRGDYVSTEMKKFLTDKNALERYKTKGVLLQNITKSDPDADLYYAIGAWFVAYLESKHSAEDYSVNFYNDLDSLGFEAAFLKTYGKSSTDYLAEFEIFINQPMDDILKIIPSTATTVVTEEVNVVVTTLGALGADTFQGTKGNDHLYGDAGNDTIFADGGSDTIDGGTGIDTLKYTLSQANYTLAVGKTNSTVKEISTGTNDSFSTIERIVFADNAVALDIDGANSAGGIYRTYKAAFNRTPEDTGFGYWIWRADNGASAVQMAEEFVWSAEFQTLYGVTTSDNYLVGNDVEAVVDLFYRNVLGRAPDQGGLDYYASTIVAQDKTGGRVLAEIADSAENRTNLLPTIENGMSYDLWVG